MYQTTGRKNSFGQEVIHINEDTAVKYYPTNPIVTISQKEPDGKDTVFESVYISKNEIIHLAGYFLRQGANHDLGYHEITGMIRDLTNWMDYIQSQK